MIIVKKPTEKKEVGEKNMEVEKRAPITKKTEGDEKKKRSKKNGKTRGKKGICGKQTRKK